MSRYFLCDKHVIEEGQAQGFSLETDRGTLELFLVKRDDTIYAYQNHCPHLGIPLNWQPDQFLSREQTHIQCSTHGALFNMDDGHCVVGPCAGDKLSSLALEDRDDDELWLQTSTIDIQMAPAT